MAAVARVGDGISHGGSIVTGASVSFAGGLAIARIGDQVDCAEHGPGTIVGGSETVFVEGAGVARVGDLVSCGAVIVGGAPDVEAG